MELFWMALGLAFGLLVSWIFRGIFGSKTGQKDLSAIPPECVRCGEVLQGAKRCWRCGLVADGPTAAELADLKAVDRQLARFEAKKLLDPETVTSLTKEIEARRRRLSRPPTPAKKAPALPGLGHSDQEEILTAVPAEPESPPLPLQPVLPASTAASVSKPDRDLARLGHPQPGEALLKPEVPTPEVPRRTLREVLAAFMEQRNIFWGELAGGLLIVGGSIALVISLWSSGTLEKVPLWQFLIFAFINAALFGGGWYTRRYWKLESTSGGLLAIATLLVPLSFLVLARLHGKVGDFWEIAVEIASVAGFIVLVEMAARVLVPGQRWWLSAAVLGASASQLLFSWFIHSGTGVIWLLAIGAVPVAGHLLCNSVALFQTKLSLGADLSGVEGDLRSASVRGQETRAQREEPSVGAGPPPMTSNAQREATHLFSFLGVSSFALAVALGYLVFASREIFEAGQYLSLLIAVGAMPALICGIVVHRDLADAPESGTLRTTATAIALSGIFLMLAAGFQAWPNAILFILVCAVDFAVFTWVAFRYELPVAHSAALLCLTAGYLALFQSTVQILLVGHLPEEGLGFDIFTSAESGKALVGLLVLLAIAAELIVRRGRAIHAVYYAFCGGVIVSWSLLLVTLPKRGIDHPQSAMWVYAIFGVCGLIMNGRWRRPVLTSVALALLAGASLWALRWRHLHLHLKGLEDAALWGSVLAGESLIMGLLAVVLAWRQDGWHAFAALGGRDEADTQSGAAKAWHPAKDFPLAAVERWQEAYREPLARSGEAVSLLAVLAALIGGLKSGSWALEHVVTSGCLMAVFLVLALAENRKWMARLAGLMLIGGVVAATGLAQAGTEHMALAPQLPLTGLCVSVAGCLMAAISVWVGSSLREGDGLALSRKRPRVLLVWRETAIVAIALALIACLPSFGDFQSVLPGCTAVFLAATTFLLVWGYQSAPLSWVASGFVLASISYALIRMYPRAEFLTPSSLALLYHATIALAASMVLKMNRAVRGSPDPAQAVTAGHPEATGDLRSSVPAGSGDPRRALVRSLFAEPLGWTGLVSSALALPILLLVPASTTFSCLGLFWLAGLWLVVSVEKRWPILFSGCQAVLVSAVLFGTTAWLETRTWFSDYPEPYWVRYFDPRSLQFFGIGLGIYCLVWMAARIGLQARRPAHRSLTVAALIDPVAALIDASFPVDRLVLAGLVLCQAALAVLGVLPGTIHELLGANAAASIAMWPSDIVPFAYGSGAWILLALLAIVLFAGLWEKLTTSAVVGLTIVAATIPILAAGDYHEQMATASALRWWLALAFLECSILVWAREPLYRLAMRVGCKVKEGTSLLPGVISQLLLALTAAPALVLTVVVATLGFIGVSPAGPESGSFFDRVGWTASNVLPPALISVVLAGYALRERSPVYAFASGLIADLTMMGGYALGVVIDGRSLGAVEWVRVIQLGTLTASVWAIGWLAARSWLFTGRKEPESSLAQPLLTVQVWLGIVGNALLAAGALWRLAVFYPPIRVAAIQEAGSALGWLALVGATAAWGYRHYLKRSLPLREAGFAGLAAILLFACDIQVWWPQWGYRALMLGWAAYPLAWMIAAWWLTFRRVAVWPSFVRPGSLVEVAAHWVGLSGTLAVLLALKAAVWHGDHPWPVVATLAVSGLTGVMALWLRRPIHVYASGLLLNLAGTMVWITAGDQPWEMLAYINVFCFALGSGIWSALELWSRNRTPPVKLRGRWLPFSHLAVTAGLLLMCMMIALVHLAPAIGIAGLQTGGFAWLALMAMVLAIVVCLWDPSAEWVCAWLYVGGLSALLLALANAQLPIRELLWTFALTVAPYLLATAAIFWASPRLQNLWRAIRLPRRPGGWPQPWLVPAQLFFGTLIVALSLWMALDFEGLVQRLAGPLAAGILILAGILMALSRKRASTSPGAMNFFLEYCTLVLGVLTVIELGWAWLDPSAHSLSWLWLHRNVIVMMALAIMTGVYGVVFVRRLPTESTWSMCSRRLGPILGVLSAAMVAVILGQEAWLSRIYEAPMAYEAIAVVALAMIGLATAGLCFAVLPGRDPLGLSERGRTIYVYTAEFIVVLIFVHLRLTLPWLFKLGIFLRYWPFILMGIAFAGVGLSEYFRRRQLRVLAEPLERTGIFLPLLPVLSYWILPYWILADQDPYALLWFLVGLVYGLASILKQSWGFALWGALAANMGLWVLLGKHDVDFLKHPQVWLIPIALIGLASELVNRDRLSDNQSKGLRYLCLMVIYVSSTADMFIAGLGQSWQEPLVLTLLSVLGILAGMALRIRAFLYLGSSFLLLVVSTMIWHAGANLGQKWIWYASMVGLGGALVGLFGLFEKRRNDILRVVDELKKWR